MTWSERLTELGIELPPVAAPVAAYVPARQVGNLVYTSGQLAFVNGQLGVTGKVGDEVSAAEAYQQARIAALNAVSVVASVLGEGGVDRIVSVVKLVGLVNSAPGFTGQPGVINGASELLGDIFGPAGQHARSAVGVSELPLDSPVEVELIVEVAD